MMWTEEKTEYGLRNYHPKERPSIGKIKLDVIRRKFDRLQSRRMNKVSNIIIKRYVDKYGDKYGY